MVTTANCLFLFKSISHIWMEHPLCAWHCARCWGYNSEHSVLWSFIYLVTAYSSASRQCPAHSRRSVSICWGGKWISRENKLMLHPGWLCSLQHKRKSNWLKAQETNRTHRILSEFVGKGALTPIFLSLSPELGRWLSLPGFLHHAFPCQLILIQNLNLSSL